MNKRIIDGMSAKQIADGWADDPQDLLEYLEDICKPVPSWEDDASADNPILCWVSDSPLPKSDGKPYSGVADHVTGLHNGGYMSASGACWKHARPISPNQCWKPTKQAGREQDDEQR